MAGLHEECKRPASNIKVEGLHGVNTLQNSLLDQAKARVQ